MTASPACTGIVRACIGPGPETLPEGVIARPRYFVAINGVLKDGTHALMVLSPYMCTLAAAEGALAEIAANFPKAEILWVWVTYELSDEKQMEELAMFEAQNDREQREGGYQ